MRNGRSAKNTGVNKQQKWEESNVWREQWKYYLTCPMPTQSWKRTSAENCVEIQTALWAGKDDEPRFTEERSWRQPKIWSEVTKVTWQEGVCQDLNAGSWYWSHFLHTVPQDYVAVSHLWSMWDSISHFSSQQINISTLNPTLSLQFILNCKHQFAWISVFSFQYLWLSPVKMVTIRAQLKP